MAYRIVYGADPVIRKGNISSARIRTLTAVCFLLFAWMVHLFWPDGREVLANTFLPGDPTLTQIAFSNLLDNLRQGVGLTESLTVFCREILHEII